MIYFWGLKSSKTLRISRAKFQDYNEMIPSQKSETTHMLPLLSKIICYFSWVILGLGKRKKYQIKLNILSLRILRKFFKQHLIINLWLSLCLPLMHSLIYGCPNICQPTNIHILNNHTPDILCMPSYRLLKHWT